MLSVERYRGKSRYYIRGPSAYIRILPLSIIRSQKLAIMQPHNILLNLLKSDQIPCDGSRMMF